MFMERFNLTQPIKPHKMNNTDHEWTHVLARGKQLLYLISNKANNTNKTLAVPQTTGYKIEPNIALCGNRNKYNNTEQWKYRHILKQNQQHEPHNL